MSVGLAVGQSSIADEVSELIKKPKIETGICYDPADFPEMLQSSVDILVATPGRLMDHINNTKGFTLEHLCYLVSSLTSLGYNRTMVQLCNVSTSDNLRMYFLLGKSFYPDSRECSFHICNVFEVWYFYAVQCRHFSFF